MILPPISVSNYGQLAVAAAVAKAIKPYAPLGFDSGGETFFEGSATILCNDGRTWTQVWDRHIQNEAIGNQRGVLNLNPPPDIDFNKNLVVALFAGRSRGVVSYRFAVGYRFGKNATLRLTPVMDNSLASRVVLPQPWAFLVLPRTDATVSIQVPGNDGWTTVATVKPSL